MKNVQVEEEANKWRMKAFKKWQSILLADVFVGYCLYYVTRKSCTYSIPLLLEDKSLSIRNEDFGLMASVQMLSYSLGRFVFGILSDTYSCKLMFSIGLFMCGFSNIIFAYCTQNLQFTVLWAINGFFQGCGWAPIAILIKRWYSPNEIGTIWSIMSVTINLSSSMIPILMTSLSDVFDWRVSFGMVGMVSCIFSSISFKLIKDHPTEVTGQTPQSNSNTTSNSSKEAPVVRYMQLLSSKFLCTVSLAYLLWTAVKNGVEDWLLVFLITEKGLTTYQASFSMMSFQVGGLVAALSSGIISDILVHNFKDKMRSSPRIPVVIFCSTFIMWWLYLLQSDITSYIMLTSITFFLGLCCYGPHTLFGLLVIENAPPGLSGAAHAIAATASTLGSVLAGYPLSFVSENYSWNMVYAILALTAMLNTAVLLASCRLSCKIKNVKDD